MLSNLFIINQVLHEYIQFTSLCKKRLIACGRYIAMTYSYVAHPISGGGREGLTISTLKS